MNTHSIQYASMSASNVSVGPMNTIIRTATIAALFCVYPFFHLYQEFPYQNNSFTLGLS